MRYIELICVFVICASYGGVTYASGEKKERTLQDWISLTQSSQKIQCSGAKTDHEIALKRNLKQKAFLFNQRIILSCECIPNKLDSFNNKISQIRKNSITSVNEFKKIITPVLNTCVATQLRQQLTLSCTEDESVIKNAGKRNKYCTCFSNKLEKLTDSELGNYANVAHREYLARANALREGKPAPKSSVTFLNEIESMCLKNI